MQKIPSNYLSQEICNVSFIQSKNIRLVSGSTKNYVLVNTLDNITFENFYFTPGSADFQENEKDLNAGNLFDQTLVCSVPGFHPDYRDFFDCASLLRLVLKITFQNGSSIIYGTPENPVLVSSKYVKSKFAHTIEFKRIGAKCHWLE